MAPPPGGGDPYLLYAGIHKQVQQHKQQRFKDHFSWHVVLEGKAVAGTGRRQKTLGPGDGYLYFPREERQLWADLKHCAWAWVGFHGAGLLKLFHHHGIRSSGTLVGGDGDHGSYVLAILRELADPRACCAEECSARLQLLINRLIRLHGDPETLQVRQSQHKAVEAAQRLIEQQIDSSFDVADIAQAVGLERSYLSRLFRAQTGITLRDAIAEARLRRAETLLDDQHLSIQAVAEMSGFKQYFSFHRFFKRHHGTSPSEWRKTPRKERAKSTNN